MNDAYLERQLAYIQRCFPPKTDPKYHYITSLRKTNPRLWGELVHAKLNEAMHHRPRNH